MVCNFIQSSLTISLRLLIRWEHIICRLIFFFCKYLFIFIKKNNLFKFVYLSGENNTMVDETISNTDQTPPHLGILKNISDENTTKPIENIKRKIGLFS